MNKVLIVDDELLARIGIKSLISWSEKGYEVVGEAENGKKALEIIEEMQPDIVITDMKMPVMNGIDLIKEAKAMSNPPDFVVLSSYDDFDYVKQALILGARDYFLKLELTPEQLVATLDQVSLSRSKSSKGHAHLKQSYVEHLSLRDYEIVKSLFLKEMLQGSYYSEHEIEQKLRDLNIIFPKQDIQCGVIALNGMEIYQKYKERDMELFQFTVQNIISEILSDYRYAHIVFTQSKEITILYSHMDPAQMTHQMEELIGAVLKALKTYLNLTGVIGISGVRAGYGSIKTSYQEALGRSKRVHLPSGIPSPVSKSDSLLLNVNDLHKQFDTILQVSDRNGMKRCLESIEGIIQATFAADKHVVKSLCSVLLLSLSSYVAEQLPMLKLEEVWGSDPYQSLDHLYTDYDCIVWIQQLDQSIVQVFNALGESCRLVNQAKQFIHANYAHNLSLESIAEELSISPNYLSYLFRKEAKESVVEYLTRHRIEQAKKLLRTSHYKVYEVGQMVGYENEQYFSRVFKKVVGMPPAKYKK